MSGDKNRMQTADDKNKREKIKFISYFMRENGWVCERVEKKGNCEKYKLGRGKKYFTFSGKWCIIKSEEKISL